MGETRGINLLPLHHMVRAGVVTILAVTVLVLWSLFWRGTHDSPDPTPEPTDYNVQLPTLGGFDD
jgi:hypothetical protein